MHVQWYESDWISVSNIPEQPANENKTFPKHEPKVISTDKFKYKLPEKLSLDIGPLHDLEVGSKVLDYFWRW